MNDFQQILDGISDAAHSMETRGQVADYIPALAEVSAGKFAMAVCDKAGGEFAAGLAAERFSVQSISKVFAAILALRHLGGSLWTRVGREPSGNPFNSLVQLEYEKGIPRNPFINAGAIVVIDCLLEQGIDPQAELLDMVRKAAGEDSIDYDDAVAASERATGHRNRALANFLKSFGNLSNDVDQVLEIYFRHCSLAMSAREVARCFRYLAFAGTCPVVGEEFITPEQTKRINELMMTCGLYDDVGDFVFRVGMPAKSGVGGGIAGVIPGEISVCVWSPGLDESGNSLLGVWALERFVGETGLSVF